MPREQDYTLVGGPFAGHVVRLRGDSPLNAEGPGVPEGFAARYMPKKDGTYVFDGLTEILFRIPLGDPS